MRTQTAHIPRQNTADTQTKLTSKASSPYKTAKSPLSKPGKTSSTTGTPRERRLTLSADKTDKPNPRQAKCKNHGRLNKDLPNNLHKSSESKVKVP